MIRFEHVSKTYTHEHGHSYALKDICLEIPEASIFGIIGSSGAGKSTLLRCINLLERPTEGKVFVEGQELTGLSDARLRHLRQKIGMIFQGFNLLTSKSVFDNIALPLKLSGKPYSADKIMELLDLVGLVEKARAYPNQLSGGQKQRVAIARALVNEPRILLCDEATSALDPTTTTDILNLLQEINRRYGITIVLITHAMRVIKSICHEVAVLERGELVEVGNILKVISQPQSTTAKQFLQQTDLKLSDRIAQNLQENYSAGLSPLIKIAFVGSSAANPIIADLILELQIKLNILEAHLEYITDQPVGSLLIEALADPQKLVVLQNRLHQQGLHTEVLGYVPTTLDNIR
jgi:D-methionine transport system ATP-binding protein